MHGRWGDRTYNNYRYQPLGSTVHYRIPVGQHYTGTMSWVVFVNDDDDAPQDGVSVFNNVVLYESDQPQNETSHLLIRAQAADSAATFNVAAHDISSRATTTASTFWRVPAWTGGTAPSDVSKQRTPDLSAMVQEVVDRDGAMNIDEYMAGTDGSDSNDVLRLRIRSKAGGKIAVGFDGREAKGPGYEGRKRYYSLLCRDTLPGATGSAVDLWYENFDLPNRTRNDYGDTAWTSIGAGDYFVSNGYFRAGVEGGIWRSERILIAGRDMKLSLRLRGTGKLDGDDYIKVRYIIDDGPETSLVERWDNFNGDAWETVEATGISGSMLQIVIRSRSNVSGGELYYWDDIKLSYTQGPGWPVVPGVSNILVDTDREIEHTNNSPAATGFYRVRARLE